MLDITACLPEVTHISPKVEFAVLFLTKHAWCLRYLEVEGWSMGKLSLCLLILEQFVLVSATCLHEVALAGPKQVCAILLVTKGTSCSDRIRCI